MLWAGVGVFTLREMDRSERNGFVATAMPVAILQSLREVRSQTHSSAGEPKGILLIAMRVSSKEV
jgi:hypothetical protein